MKKKLAGRVETRWVLVNDLWSLSRQVKPSLLIRRKPDQMIYIYIKKKQQQILLFWTKSLLCACVCVFVYVCMHVCVSAYVWVKS